MRLPKLPFSPTLPVFVILTLGILAWTGSHMTRGELEQVERNFESLMISKLKEVQAGFFAFLVERELAMVGLDGPLGQQGAIQLIPGPIAASVSSATPTMTVGSAGVALFPDLDALDFSALATGTQTPDVAQVFAYLQTWASRAPNPRAGRLISGLRSWSGATDTYMFFMHRKDNGALLVRAQPVRELFADYANTVPREFFADFPGSQTCILLTGPGNQRLGLLGDSRAVTETGGKPRAMLVLRKPLESFRLQLFTPREQVVERLQSVAFAQLIGWFGVAALGLGALALQITRENQRERAEAMAKVSFVNQVSHELKAPLTNIKMYVDLVQMQVGANPDEDREMLRIASSEADRLTGLIDQILTFARTQKSPFLPHPRPCRPDQVIDMVLASFRPALEAGGIRVEVQSECRDEVSIDPQILARILENLVANVVKHAAAGRLLCIHTTCSGAMLSVSVTDNGPGIAPNVASRLFEPFLRADDAVAAKPGGTGLGLSISRELARSHGGDLVLVTNNGPVTAVAPDSVGGGRPDGTAARAPGCCFLVRLALIAEGKAT